MLFLKVVLVVSKAQYEWVKNADASRWARNCVKSLHERVAVERLDQGHHIGFLNFSPCQKIPREILPLPGSME